MISAEALQQILQAIQPDLIHGSDQLPEFPWREPLVLKPNQVGFREITDQFTFILSEGHWRTDEIF